VVAAVVGDQRRQRIKPCGNEKKQKYKQRVHGGPFAGGLNIVLPV
jgi:hypothetical protein